MADPTPHYMAPPRRILRFFAALWSIGKIFNTMHVLLSPRKDVPCIIKETVTGNFSQKIFRDGLYIVSSIRYNSPKGSFSFKSLQVVQKTAILQTRICQPIKFFSISERSIIYTIESIARFLKFYRTQKKYWGRGAHIEFWVAKSETYKKNRKWLFGAAK